MPAQDKGSLCACNCGMRKPNRKRRFYPGHPQRTVKTLDRGEQQSAKQKYSGPRRRQA